MRIYGQGCSRARSAGQGAARFSHYVPRLFEILTVQYAHPAQGVAITTTAAAVHGTQERGRLFRRVLDEGACEKVELCRRCALRVSSRIGHHNLRRRKQPASLRSLSPADFRET